MAEAAVNQVRLGLKPLYSFSLKTLKKPFTPPSNKIIKTLLKDLGLFKNGNNTHGTIPNNFFSYWQWHQQYGMMPGLFIRINFSAFMVPL